MLLFQCNGVSFKIFTIFSKKVKDHLPRFFTFLTKQALPLNFVSFSSISQAEFRSTAYKLGFIYSLLLVFILDLWVAI